MDQDSQLRELRRDQEQGGGAWLSLRVEQSFASVVPQQLLFGHCDFALHSR